MAAVARAVRRAVWLALVALVFAFPAPPNPRVARPIVVVAANQSFNWSGYVQGRLEKNATFHSIAATWRVPVARPHRAGEAEYSSSWIGIGGGCLDTSCKLTDVTLIQAGIGHDVDASGKADYYAWWEAIPAPLVRTDLRVRAELVDFDLTLIATPSLPDRQADGFNDCTYRVICPAPRRS